MSTIGSAFFIACPPLGVYIKSYNFAGVNGHYDAIHNSLTCCVRFGPGIYVGGGSEIGIATANSASNWAVGLAGDAAFGNEGLSVAALANSDSFSLSGNYRIPTSLGIGLSAGVDFCYTYNFK